MAFLVEKADSLQGQEHDGRKTWLFFLWYLAICHACRECFGALAYREPSSKHVERSIYSVGRQHRNTQIGSDTPKQ
ncbi:hypothetical protein JMJ77_0008523 [Colletotrichum scovillei]|uniref:Uncharacterized protein n=1 Tax=Colletotrichum scovillei TaxID=1209932 RepID=A0A9P7REB9_9PEZI|nr:hypothetical protein JMJ77_0008523 [Colletotrichum scovillei]KAG7075518.1 hypothetical protein JMJ76_0011978 [Colletotrichum scovillei]KAG7082669.1 hypothetical protein JMJ78_0004770 [Colletotrichum scovillei]